MNKENSTLSIIDEKAFTKLWVNYKTRNGTIFFAMLYGFSFGFAVSQLKYKYAIIVAIVFLMFKIWLFFAEKDYAKQSTHLYQNRSLHKNLDTEKMFQLGTNDFTLKQTAIDLEDI